MFRPSLFPLIIGVILFCAPVRSGKTYLNAQSTTISSWGAPGGTQCYSNSVRAYASSQTLSISTATNINYIRCWGGSRHIPTSASLIGGGVGTTSATIQLSSTYRKIFGGCEAFCM